MRCKIGDICRIVGGDFSENRDKFVLIIGRCKFPEFDWEVEALQEIRTRLGEVPAGFKAIGMDNDLQPIRDQPGDDETLTWAGRPADFIAPLHPEFACALEGAEVLTWHP